MSKSDYPRIPSACPHDCPSTCALEVEKIDAHTIGRVYGAKENDYTSGVICAKVSRYAERIHHPQRLTTPLQRVGPKGEGLSSFKPISWTQALDRVADNMRQVSAEYSPQAIWPYHYAGTMGLVQRDCLDRLRHVLGTSLQHSTFCTTLADAGWMVGTGSKRGADVRDMIHSDVIVVWGGNPVSTQVNVMHHIAKARRENNAKLVVIDPYVTGTAKKADLHLMLKPGTDGALACAVMHVLFAENYADRDYMAEFTDSSEELEQWLIQRTPEWAANITGIEAHKIIEFARLYGRSKKTFIRLGYGFSRSRNGAVNMHAATCLPAITGAWRVRGGGALYGNKDIYAIDKTLISATDRMDASLRVLDQSRIGEVLCGNPSDLGDGPPIKSLFVQNTNPLVVAPDTNRVHEGLSREDLFVCVHEQFMTETAAMADIVLPATMFLEHDDMYQASGHTYLQVTKKVIEPAAECKSNHWVLCELARRLDLEHEGFNLSEWELMDQALKSSGLPAAEELYKNRWHECAGEFTQSNFLSGFATHNKRFHFKPNWANVGKHSQGMPIFPDHWESIDSTSQQHPYRLVAAPARQFLNTTFTETATSRKMEKQPQVLIHPTDCKALGVQSGDQVRVGNRLGDIALAVLSFAGLQPGTVVIESIWPNKDFAGSKGVNTLVSSSPGQPNGGAVFHDTAVWIKPVTAEPV